MLAAVVPWTPAYHGDVRLGLRLLVECDRSLRADHPTGPERGSQGVLHEAQRGVVSTPLWLADDQLTAKQLDRVTGSEDADLDEPVILRASPPPRPHRIRRHAAEATAEARRGQCLESVTLDPHWTTEVITLQIMRHVFKTLYTFDKDWRPPSVTV